MSVRRKLALRFLADHPDESARLSESMPPAEAVALLSACPPEIASDVLRRVVPSVAAGLLAAVPLDGAARVAERLPLGIAASLLRRMAPETREALLDGVAAGSREALARLLAHAEDSAGGMMDPRVFTLPRDVTVAEAIERLRERPEHAMYYLYVVDREQRLAGVLNYRDMLLAERDAPLSSIIRSPVTSVPATARSDTLASHPAWRTYLALPVVDGAGTLLGVLRYERVRELDLAQQAQRRAGSGLSAPLTVAEGVWRRMSDLMGSALGGRDRVGRPGGEGDRDGD